MLDNLIIDPSNSLIQGCNLTMQSFKKRMHSLDNRTVYHIDKLSSVTKFLKTYTLRPWGRIFAPKAFTIARPMTWGAARSSYSVFATSITLLFSTFESLDNRNRVLRNSYKKKQGCARKDGVVRIAIQQAVAIHFFMFYCWKYCWKARRNAGDGPFQYQGHRNIT